MCVYVKVQCGIRASLPLFDVRRHLSGVLQIVVEAEQIRAGISRRRICPRYVLQTDKQYYSDADTEPYTSTIAGALAPNVSTKNERSRR